jgi:hypothetical protein
MGTLQEETNQAIVLSGLNLAKVQEWAQVETANPSLTVGLYSSPYKLVFNENGFIAGEISVSSDLQCLELYYQGEGWVHKAHAHASNFA